MERPDPSGFPHEQLQNVLQRQAGRASLEVCVCECVCEHSTHVPAVSAVTTLTHGRGGGRGDAVGALPETTLGWKERQAPSALQFITKSTIF